MYLTEQEFRGQFDALEQTVQALLDDRDRLAPALAEVKFLCVIGCGSSFSLAKSAATQFAQHTGRPSVALAAGDLLVNFSSYQKMLQGAHLLILSRSGATSEVVRAARLCRDTLQNPIISICAKAGAPIETLADVNILLPWAFDRSVCQTRTVTNLYAAGLILAMLASGDEAGLRSLVRLKEHSTVFCPQAEPLMKEAAAWPWTKAVVLADSAMAGLAEEGALAFKEICRRDSNFYHLLDVRHGPMVQIGPDTLVIALVSSGDRELQAALLADVAQKTDKLLTFDCGKGGVLPGTCIPLPDCGGDEVRAVFLLYCIQSLTFQHALVRGVDPDQPEGLDPWIKL